MPPRRWEGREGILYPEGTAENTGDLPKRKRRVDKVAMVNSQRMLWWLEPARAAHTGLFEALAERAALRPLHFTAVPDGCIPKASAWLPVSKCPLTLGRNGSAIQSRWKSPWSGASNPPAIYHVGR